MPQLITGEGGSNPDLGKLKSFEKGLNLFQIVSTEGIFNYSSLRPFPLIDFKYHESSGKYKTSAIKNHANRFKANANFHAKNTPLQNVFSD